jgi:hypothetical protein
MRLSCRNKEVDHDQCSKVRHFTLSATAPLIG